MERRTQLPSHSCQGYREDDSICESEWSVFGEPVRALQLHRIAFFTSYFLLENLTILSLVKITCRMAVVGLLCVNVYHWKINDSVLEMG